MHRLGEMLVAGMLLCGGQVVGAQVAGPVLGRVHTPLFSMQVPSGWDVLRNADGELVMGSRRSHGSIRMPMLLVQFCAEGAAVDGLRVCPDSCTQAIRRISQHLGQTMYLEPLQQAELKGRVTEYRTMVPDKPEKQDVTWIALSCSPQGQAFVTLVSDQVDQAGIQFDSLLRHLRWTTVPSQPSLHRAPRH